MQSKKRTIIQVIVCVGLICLIWGGYYVLTRYGTDRILEELKKDDFSWVYQVDSVKTEGKDFVLQGFAFKLDKNAEEEAFEIVLEDIESGKRYFPEMEYVERKDVNEYFLCEYDYLQTGFEATIKAKKLSLEQKSYEVLLRVKGDRLAYRTGTYISNGKLAYANPFEFESLDVVGTSLEAVTKNGMLRVYRPDYGIYVYQYEGELYWIAESQSAFDENGDLGIPFQLNTTQIDKLPENRLENNWLWDNKGFLFSANEITDWSTGRYRVAKEELPKEYSIEKIWTGKHDGDWIWIQYFRPYYQFN